jgi:hypothetical protein
MRKFAALVLILALISYTQSVDPTPGSLELNLNLKGLNNMFGMLFPIILQETVQGK